jgi:hypothetical protein
LKASWRRESDRVRRRVEFRRQLTREAFRAGKVGARVEVVVFIVFEGSNNLGREDAGDSVVVGRKTPTVALVISGPGQVFSSGVDGSEVPDVDVGDAVVSVGGLVAAIVLVAAGFCI